jgi:hypothetical protein
MTAPKKELWHFDKGIPISIVVMLIAQAAGAIWWVGGLSKQTEENSKRIAHIEAQRVSERVTTLEYQRIDDRGSLVRIENKLDRLIEKERP